MAATIGEAIGQEADSLQLIYAGKKLMEVPNKTANDLGLV